VKEIRRHLSDTVESRFRRRVDDLVPPERVQALSLVLGEHGFSSPQPQLQTFVGEEQLPIVVLRPGATVWLSVVVPNVRLLLRFEQPQHGTEHVARRSKRK
jgi:hypothetical protein